MKLNVQPLDVSSINFQMRSVCLTLIRFYLSHNYLIRTRPEPFVIVETGAQSSPEKWPNDYRIIITGASDDHHISPSCGKIISQFCLQLFVYTTGQTLSDSLATSMLPLNVIHGKAPHHCNQNLTWILHKLSSHFFGSLKVALGAFVSPCDIIVFTLHIN